MYPSDPVYVNGQPFSAIAVNNTTYLLYTVLSIFGIKYSSFDPTTHTFTLTTGQKIVGVAQGNTTYIPYDAIPGIKVGSLNGRFNFTNTGSASTPGTGIFSSSSTGLVLAGAAVWGAWFLLRKMRG